MTNFNSSGNNSSVKNNSNFGRHSSSSSPLAGPKWPERGPRIQGLNESHYSQTGGGNYPAVHRQTPVYLENWVGSPSSDQPQLGGSNMYSGGQMAAQRGSSYDSAVRQLAADAPPCYSVVMTNNGTPTSSRREIVGSDPYGYGALAAGSTEYTGQQQHVSSPAAGRGRPNHPPSNNAASTSAENNNFARHQDRGRAICGESCLSRWPIKSIDPNYHYNNNSRNFSDACPQPNSIDPYSSSAIPPPNFAYGNSRNRVYCDRNVFGKSSWWFVISFDSGFRRPETATNIRSGGGLF